MTMTYAHDFIGSADLPGELDRWEALDEPTCGLCGHAGTDTGTGLCPLCLDRTPRIGGCGLGLALAAALTGTPDGGPLVHLTRCGACREFFGTLAGVAWVADMETPHAALLAGSAA